MSSLNSAALGPLAGAEVGPLLVPDLDAADGVRWDCLPPGVETGVSADAERAIATALR